MRNIFILFIFMLVGSTLAAQSGLPTNPDPNKCYVRCITPDVYETEEVRIETRPAYKKLSVVPARYEPRTERVLVREAYTRYEVTAPEFSKDRVTFQSRMPYNKVKVQDASLGDDTKVVVVAPKAARWEYTPYEGCESDNPLDCQVLCYREYPEQTRTIPIKTLAADATYTTAPTGADEGGYQVTRVSKPAAVREIPVPAEYKDITKQVLVADESVQEELVPAEFTTYERQVLKTKGGLEQYEEINCELLEYNVLPINYELGTARLTSASKRIIDEKLLTLLTAKPNIRIEINSHTDSRGSSASNRSLSNRRAQVVKDYLMSKGISGSRLVASGKGETELKNRCADGVTCTEREHAVNRRTEFRVLNN